MTWRGAALLAAPLVLVAAGAAASALLPVGLACIVIAVAVVAADARRAPGRARIRVQREHEPLLSVGSPNNVTLRIVAPPCRAWVRDEAPREANATPSLWRTGLPATLSYALRPQVRGELRLGRTVVRAEGPWRLTWRQSAPGGPEVVPVEADIAAVRVYEALARRGQLAELGVRRLRLRTEGTEFERVRDAVPDDPQRAINWRATARTGRLMATELMPERAQPVIACIDHGRLMGTRAGALSKLDHAVNAALLLLLVALRTGDRAGVVAFADTVGLHVAPHAGPAQLRAVLEALRSVQPVETEADYEAFFAELSRLQRRRALVVVFTDVLDRGQGATLMREAARLRRRHLLLVVTVRDTELDELAERTPRTSADVYARAAAGAAISDRDESLRLLRLGGVDTIDAAGGTVSPRVVNRYLEVKRRAVL